MCTAHLTICRVDGGWREPAHGNAQFQEACPLAEARSRVSERDLEGSGRELSRRARELPGQSE